jgi:predicted metal-dependent hydrolase
MGDGLSAFKSGHFYQARELWEAEGLVARGNERTWIKGLAEVAAGFLRCDESALSVAERLLFKGLHHLTGAPPEVAGVDTVAVREAAAGLLDALKRGQPANPRSMLLQAA